MLMAYDEHGAGSEVSGSVASLPWVEDGIQKTLQEACRRKADSGYCLLYASLAGDKGEGEGQNPIYGSGRQGNSGKGIGACVAFQGGTVLF